jgi:proteasome alpha subunit
MTMPFYVAPEQVMKDRADYARKGIARGRSLAAASCREGILIVAENPSRTLRKISEIYDRIAFAGVGKYNEFDQLRVAGVRHADTTGYAFSREDVDARSLANVYAQYLGQVFTHEMKPLEVEILVAQVGDEVSSDELYHLLFDGTVVDEIGFSVLGGEAEAIAERLGPRLSAGAPLAETLPVLVEALAGPERTLGTEELEVAVLDRSGGRRRFRRLEGGELERALRSPEGPGETAPSRARRSRPHRDDGAS